MTETPFQPLTVDGLTYLVEVLRRVEHPPSSPRLVIIAFQPNPQASRILEVCIRAIQRYTPELHELWVIDNNSPSNNSSWLREIPDINIAFNRTFPIPPKQRLLPWNHVKSFQHQQRWGSYANAIGLEIAARTIEPKSHFLVTLHMDTAPCRSGWLSFLQLKLNDHIRAAGVHLQRNRVAEGVLHVLGLLLDFQLFRKLQLDFLPYLPQFDVGDRVTIDLRRSGYDVAACRDTLNQPELINQIPASSPCKDFKVFRALDDENQAIFLHLGRGGT